MHMCRSTNLGLCSHPNETFTSLVISASLVNDFVGHQSTSGLHMPMQFNNKTLFEAPCIWCIYNCRNCFRITSFLNFWNILENHVDYKVFEAAWVSESQMSILIQWCQAIVDMSPLFSSENVKWLLLLGLESVTHSYLAEEFN